MLQPWYWRSLPLEHRTGSEVFAALFLGDSADRLSEGQEGINTNSIKQIATLLESPHPSPSDQPQLSRYSICAGSPRIVDGQPQLWTPPVGEILPFLRQLIQRSERENQGADENAKSDQGKHCLTPHSLPFTGGWLGWLGYDLAWEIERLPVLNSDPLPFPVAYWYEPVCFAVLDHWGQTLWLAATNSAELDLLQDQLEQAKLSESGNKSPFRTGKHKDFSIQNLITPSKIQNFWTPQADYENAVRQAKKYIDAGDIFQANLSLRFEASTSADSWDIYQALQQINPSPFASYWQTPWGAMMSCSPERLVQLQSGQDGKLSVSTRPIAGTRSRGTTPALDDQLAQELITNAKERAEHIMLVDLERNDLGRVCQAGSVRVDELLTIERYSHVMHLVSNVTGILQPSCDAVDLIRALFPGGTITGCPKVRCMEIIEELEPVRRSLFYGSCGYLDCRGQLDLNILIRTLLLTHRDGVSTVWGQVGAGIVADSDPEKEWNESLHKAQAQLTALSIFDF